MNTVLLFGMPGGAELFFIVLVIIMLFGSKKIPELARGLGKGMREIKNATGDIQREIREGAKDINNIKDKVDVEKQVKDLIKGDKEKKQETGEEKKDPLVSKDKLTANGEKTETTTTEPKTQDSIPISQTVQRRSPYAKEEPQTTSDKD
ncbi:MAG: twin-arginine translocase TatA/TatE family subunit [Vicingaceae bacterium]|nr:twin-arginine translocase TatA/TatE family subunit [Vicingaceae bacterium]